ncbi:hypothetical protein HY029_00760 [Candidatus Gottesmanbacteria bacterium]|nr:hypothetical protein [Candidatus Gottesmanbacteria bacterium]
MDNNVWMEILEYARWSASPHNVQPWKIEVVSATEANILYDPIRLLPVEDPTGCFTTAGFGMFIENLSVAAHSKGFKIEEKYTETILDHTKKELTPFAKIKLVKTDDKEIFDRELITERRTSRLPYNGKPVTDDVIRELVKIAMEFGHTFTFSKDMRMINWVLTLNRDTIFYDMNDAESRNEIGLWLRYSAEDAHKKNDGLWAHCMNFPGALMYLFFHTRWLFNFPIINSFVKYLYLQSTSGTRTVAWLSGPFNTPYDWLNAGHMLARLWLCMTKHHVYLHPFGSIITNKKSHKRLREKFNVEEKTNKIWLIVRLGYSKLPPRSLRLSVADILV